MKKRALSFLLALLMFIGIFSVFPVISNASNGVQNKINEIKAVYGNGSYFTKSGNACYDSGGSDCQLSRIPSRGGLPSGQTVANAVGDGWSCYGFMSYVFYCVFGQKWSNGTVVSSPSLGDAMEWNQNGNTHYAIYIGQDSNYWYVYDSNWGLDCGVQYDHRISKSWRGGVNRIFHATNYNLVDNGGSVAYSDISEKVYYIQNKAQGTYLNVAYGKDEDAANVHLYKYADYDALKFKVDKYSSKVYTIRPTYSQRLVNPYADTVTSGVNVNIYHNTGDDTQRWYFEAASDGYYYIRNKSNTSCVIDGTDENVVVKTYSGNDYQKWKLIPAYYTVSYNANGGSGAPSSQTKSYLQILTLSSAVPTRNGYVFLGWSTTSDGTAAYYAGGKYTTDADVTLYAVWKKTDTPELINSSVYNNNEYSYYSGWMTWEDAEKWCEQNGGHLATIRSAEENAIVNGIANNKIIWLGASDIENEGSWKWVTGEEFEYTNWAPEEPNNNGGIYNSGKEDYLGMYTNGEWNDYNLISTRIEGFVLEKDNVHSDTNHFFGEWTITTGPTCTENGEKTRICSYCGKVEAEIIPALGHAWTDWTVTIEPKPGVEGLKERHCTRCNAVETDIVEPLPMEGVDWYVDNYKFVIRNGATVNYIRIAPGVWTTSAEIRAAEGLIQVDKKLCNSMKDENGVLTYEFIKGGVYSIWVRYDNGNSYVVSGVDLTEMIPAIGAVNGLTVTVDNLYLDDAKGVKDIWIARGTLESYAECKDAANKIVQITANRIAQANYNYARSYKYEINYKNASDNGEYTVCVRFNDAKRANVILHYSVEYPQPEIIVNGLRSTVTALAGV